MGCLKLIYRENKSPLKVIYRKEQLKEKSVQRCLSTDPLVAQYLSISSYNYVAGNPVKFVDPDGKEIRIYYENDNGDSVYEVYTPGMENNFENEFLSNAVDGLNYIYNNDADIVGILDELSQDEDEHVNIQFASDGQDKYHKNTVYWNDKMGLETYRHENGERIEGRQSAAIGLFHEVAHAYLDTFHSYGSISKVTLDNYDDTEEKLVIDEYETPAVKILQGKGYNESWRDNHRGRNKRYNGPLSVETKAEYKRRKRKEKK